MNQELSQSFDRRLRYKHAHKLAKPLLGPVQFIKNQLRQVRSPVAGTIQEVDAFHLPGFVVVAGEAISEGIACHGLIEPELTGAFLRLVKPGQTVLDIGMHLGYFATLFAKLVGASGKVHAFEPTPSTRELAQRNTGRFPVITVHPNAMWSHRDKMIFHDYGPTNMAFNSVTAARVDEALISKAEFEVEAISLDDFRAQLGSKIDVIKVDAETAELRILEGAKKTFAGDRPIVTLEVGDESADTGRSLTLIETMLGMDYRAWEFHNGRFVTHVLRDSYTYDNLIFAPSSDDLS